MRKNHILRHMRFKMINFGFQNPTHMYMREGCLIKLIVFLKKFWQFKTLKMTFFSPLHSLVSIGKTTHRPVEKKGLDENF